MALAIQYTLSEDKLQVCLAAGATGKCPSVVVMIISIEFKMGHEDPHGHVHFDNSLHDSVVTVMQDKDGNYLVKVGLALIFWPLHYYIPTCSNNANKYNFV
uniref:Uncharacterized protein n=1 Tax=Eptatretus burgeri TaxID=7764 RepID=A0A8C4Q3U1_EPTBU